MPLLPPETIQVRGVKRSASSDDPNSPDEEYLRIQDEFSGNVVRYVYKRIKRPRTAGNQLQALQDPARSVISPPAPVSQIQPDNHSIISSRAPQVTHSHGSSLHDNAASNAITAPQDVSSNVRRFHITQPVSKGTHSTFAKPRTKNKTQVLFETRKPAQIKEKQWTVPTNTMPAPFLVQKLTATPPLRNVRQPSGRMLTHDASAAEVDEAMQAYTLDSIGIALAASTPKTPVQKCAPPLISQSGHAKFKPKAPSKRYHERHPSDEAVGAVSHDDDTDMMDMDDSLVEDFIRVPIEEVQMDSLKTIGVLVIDAQEDAEAFYGEGSDDEDEIYDEEEDENEAENHHSTEYPDEEVDSDDEFDRNPYSYRRGNASDDEDFDLDEATFSDDEDVVGTTKSWSRKPPWMRSQREIEEAELEEWN